MLKKNHKSEHVRKIRYVYDSLSGRIHTIGGVVLSSLGHTCYYANDICIAIINNNNTISKEGYGVVQKEAVRTFVYKDTEMPF